MSLDPKVTHASVPTTVRGRGILISGHAGTETIVYCTGKSVILRNLRDPSVCDIYTEHGYPTTVARLSPNGEWVASADSAGNVKVWGAHGEHVLKFETRPISGSIDDLQWSGDGQRIVVGGDGKEHRVKCFMWDSGNSVGEFDGIGKRTNTVDFKPTRPFRILTGSEDFKVNHYEGPPFKFKSSVDKHSNYVNCVRYSPNGEKAISVSSDKKGLILDAKTGEVLAELQAGPQGDGHTGSIYAASWSPDGTKVLTVSADKTAKVWEVDTAAPAVLQTFTFAAKPQVEHMQVGCAWVGEFVVSVALSGDLSYLDLASGKVARTVSGHSKTITCLAAAGSGELYAASYDGVVTRWDPALGCVGRLEGKGHGSSVAGMACTSTSLMSVGVDEKLIVSPRPAHVFGDTKVALAGCPFSLSLAAAGDVAVVATSKGVQLLRGGAVVSTTACSYGATCACISPDGTQVAVGGDDMHVHLYQVAGDALTEASTLERHRGTLVCVAFSADSSMLASGDQNREVLVWDAISKEVKMSKMVFHTSRVLALAWCPDNVHLASGGLDMSIIIWDVTADATKRMTAPRAHIDGVSSLLYLDANTLVSGGADGCIRYWTH